MTTFADLVAETSSSLHSYTGVQEQVAWLTADVTSTDTTLPIAGAETATRGVTEIGDELVYVHTTTATGLSIAPFGRGYRGTTAAAHSLNDQVTIDPAWPRFEIKRAINQAIANLYPTLYRVKTYDFQLDSVAVGYEIPSDVEQVLKLEWQQNGDPYKLWQPIFNWSVDVSSPGSSTGKMLNLFEGVSPGSMCRMVYQAKFGSLINDSDTLESVGLGDNHIDLIVYAVAARMVRFLDPARLQLTSVENTSRGQLVATGDAGKIANQMYAMYQQRLTEERRRLITSLPPSINFSG
jgi:hypothetical protein